MPTRPGGDLCYSRREFRGINRPEAGSTRERARPTSAHERTVPNRPPGLTPAERSRFEVEILVHLDVAYRVARRLLRDDHDAQDAVQDAILRALRYFAGFRGTSGRAWLLAIVRNTCRTRRRRDWLRTGVEFDESQHGETNPTDAPEHAAERGATATSIERALAGLAEPLREVVVLREVEGLSYKEIAAVMHAPIGTVMSRLARARAQLEQALARIGEGAS